MRPSRRTTARVPQKGLPVLRSEHAQIQDSWPLILRGSRSLSSGRAEPVIGRAFARPVGADPLARTSSGNGEAVTQG